MDTIFFRMMDCDTDWSCSKQEVHVRYVGFGAEEDEWVNARDSVRVRSVALEHSDCQKVKVGDLVVCFQVSFSLYTRHQICSVILS